MVRKRSATTAATGYEKVSATLEEPVLRMIREKTGNVSGFLNEAAKDKLYFDHLRATADDLRRQGVRRHERLYRNLNKWLDEVEAREAQRPVRRRRA